MRRTFRTLGRTAAICGALVALTSAARAEGPDDRLARLQALYRCPIFSYLEAIHRTKFKSETNRFLIVEIAPGDSRYFVQCAFFDRDSKIHCEAASPFYDERLKQYLTSGKLDMLGKLGFTTEASKNNYFFERLVATPEALYGIAGVLVEVLGRVFDMKLSEAVIYQAPLVSRPPRSSALDLCGPKTSMR